MNGTGGFVHPLCPLPPDKLERIAYRNAERIFGIKPAS